MRSVSFARVYGLEVAYHLWDNRNVATENVEIDRVRW